MLKRTVGRYLAGLIVAGTICAPISVRATTASGSMPEHIPGGGFELGMVDLQVHRFPRYLPPGSAVPIARLDDRSPIDGVYSLYLPALPEGGYRITPQMMSLVPGRRYRLAVSTRSSAPVELTL
ncbi:MAG: hypothetical protein ACYDDA_15550, partial [Acidiferrobacteraceae bacterium]